MTYSPHGMAYVNGRYLPRAQALIRVEDRGLQFADSIYEVMEIRNGALVDIKGHLDRLWHSLSALTIKAPMERSALMLVANEVVRRAHLTRGALYIQITRGVSPRRFGIPAIVRPTLIIMANRMDETRGERARKEGVAVITLPDMRWGRCDIKTTALLPACLALTEARANDAGDAWLVDRDGFVTEATSSNAWIVENNRTVLRTCPTSSHILKGVTRTAVMEIGRAMGLCIRQEAFTPAEAAQADEAFESSSWSRIVPITSIDRHVLGAGTPGSLTQEIARRYDAYANPPQEKSYPWGPA